MTWTAKVINFSEKQYLLPRFIGTLTLINQFHQTGNHPIIPYNIIVASLKSGMPTNATWLTLYIILSGIHKSCSKSILGGFMHVVYIKFSENVLPVCVYGMEA